MRKYETAEEFAEEINGLKSDLPEFYVEYPKEHDFPAIAFKRVNFENLYIGFTLYSIKDYTDRIADLEKIQCSYCKQTDEKYSGVCDESK